MTKVYTQLKSIPFDRKLLTLRLKKRNANRNDLINHPLIKFSCNQLSYFENIGTIPEEYLDQINKVLSDPNFKGSNVEKGCKYNGHLVDFGPSEFFELKKRCKKIKISVTELCCYDHIAYDTLTKYKKERHIPSDLLEKLNTRLSMLERINKAEEKVVEKVPEAPKAETEVTIKVESEKVYSNFAKVVQSLKKVVHCNNEANLNLDNISERYDCDIKTFVNSVFSLVSSENYVIYTTYSNGKPVFTLGEPDVEN